MFVQRFGLSVELGGLIQLVIYKKMDLKVHSLSLTRHHLRGIIFLPTDISTNVLVMFQHLLIAARPLPNHYASSTNVLVVTQL